MMAVAVERPTEDRSAETINLEILRHKLQAMVGEMTVPLARTAVSRQISEDRDYATAIVDRDGGVAAIDNPLHLGAIARTSAHVLSYFKFDMKDGDVVLASDPYRGGTHVQDFTVLKPLVVDNVIVLYLVARAHMPDFAGQVAGNYFPTAREIWAEGAPLSPIKIQRYERPVRDLVTTVLLNSRQPEAVRQALDAMLAAIELGRRRVDEVIDGYGIDPLRSAMAYSQDYVERRTRFEISRWSDGEYSGEASFDQDPATGAPVTVRVNATVDGDTLKLDFSESDEQRPSFVNSTLSNTEGFALLPLLSLLGDDVAANGGVLRAVEVSSKPGTVTNASFPSPVGWSTVHCGIEIAEATARALREATDAAFGTLLTPQTLLFSRPADDRDDFIDLSCWGVGGASASRHEDAWGRPGPLSRSVIPSIERWETEQQIRLRSWEFVTDSAGAGAHRGAPAVEAVIDVPDDHVFTFCVEGRDSVAPGVASGHDGAPSALSVEGSSGGEEAPPVLVEQPLDASAIRLRLGGGAGYGDPMERDPESVLVDVLDGIVSPEAAKRAYGVVLAEDGMAVDADATKTTRAQGG
jgi:N-methylhydantoinase B